MTLLYFLFIYISIFYMKYLQVFTSEGSLRLRSPSTESRLLRWGDDWAEVEVEGGGGACWQNRPSISSQSRSAMGECLWL